MERKSKYSKEVKIKACKDYEIGNFSFVDIAKKIGCTGETVRKWYLIYKEFGSSAIGTSGRNNSYTKEFKMSVIEEYMTEKYSLTDLGIKYNTPPGVINVWVNTWYNGIEMKDYDPKGDVYAMKSRKTTMEERLEIVKWIINNDMNYKNAADKYALNYALVYRWTQLYISKGPKSLSYQKRGPKLKSEIDESSLTEVDKLKIELEKEISLRKRREFELKILKKKEEFEQQLRSRK